MNAYTISYRVLKYLRHFLNHFKKNYNLNDFKLINNFQLNFINLKEKLKIEIKIKILENNI